MENKLPERKATHLKNYDYSKTGVYFVTICTEDRKRCLSKIVKEGNNSIKETDVEDLVGECLGAPEIERFNENILMQNSPIDFADNYKILLTPIGKVTEEQILDLENRYTNVKIKSYVIMPDHIHVLIYLRMEEGAPRHSPTLNDIVCAFKSLTSKKCKVQFGMQKLFQRSYSDHIIRDREDYDVRMKYIHENPIRWYYRILKLKENSNT